MMLAELRPTIEPWPGLGPELQRFRLDCPACGKLVEIAIRIGAPQPHPMCWGVDVLDVATMTVTPSIANPRHGRTVCPAHFTIDAGVVNMR
jgi:hypothetical protein